MSALAEPTYDVLIIGSGAAGLGLALRLPTDYRCALVCKQELSEGSTQYAQGGISAVLDAHDSLASHVADTLNAGAGLCQEPVVRQVVARGAANIRWLSQVGVPFTLDQADYHLTREGGHSHRRIVHAADATGQAVQTGLLTQIRQRPGVQLYEHHVAIDLILHPATADQSRRCIGAYCLDTRHQRIIALSARYVVLATGGASKVYLYTSNPDVATGDGIAMAWRAGCRVGNMEFMQFHPTCLYHPQAGSFLISEALRGEGATLHLPQGERFMPRHDPRAELAPRDIVARAIDHEMKQHGLDYVHLDISHKPAAFIEQHFPTILARCQRFGLDLRRQPLPVVPAAHYTCGGVVVGPQGETDITGLYAIGETAYTGLHGANRMASNSLLECLVYSELAAQHITAQALPRPAVPPPWDASRVTHASEQVTIAHNWEELRRCLWNYVGIVRSNRRLAQAKRRINLLRHEIADYYTHFQVNRDLIELRNLADVADLIIQSAQRRRESRGLHYTVDFPHSDPAQCHPTLLIPDNYAPVHQCPGSHKETQP